MLLAVQCGLGGRMPKAILEEEEAREVAQFVAAYAGQIDKGPVVNIADTPPPEPQSLPLIARATSCGSRSVTDV